MEPKAIHNSLVLKKLNRFLPSLLLAVILSSDATFCADKSTKVAARSKKEVWVLGVLHRSSGQYLYYITDDAVKLVNTNNGGIVIAKAPEWRVSCFRTSEKLEYLSDLRNFDKSSISALIPVKSKAPLLIHPKYDAGIEELSGLPCKKTTIAEGNTVWVAADIKPAAQISELIARYFGSPDLEAITVKEIRGPRKKNRQAKDGSDKRKTTEGVPWAAFNDYGDTGNPLQVSLTSWKKVPFNSAYFEYPKNYKRTKDLQQVIISRSNRAQIVNLIEDITLGKSGDPKKK